MTDCSIHCDTEQVGTVVERNKKTFSPAYLTKDKDFAYSTVKDLVYRLQKKDAFNIAVTGPFGSGKSSVLYTLERDFQEYTYLNVSLATLQQYITEKKDVTEVDDSIEPKKKDSEKQEKENFRDCADARNRRIEYSILQQLIYKEDASTLRYSRLKRISDISSRQLNKYTFIS